MTIARPRLQVATPLLTYRSMAALPLSSFPHPTLKMWFYFYFFLILNILLWQTEWVVLCCAWDDFFFFSNFILSKGLEVEKLQWMEHCNKLYIKLLNVFTLSRTRRLGSKKKNPRAINSINTLFSKKNSMNTRTVWLHLF